MHKVFLQLSAMLGAVSVALGAFGAHAIKKMVSDATVNIFETAVRYQFYHVFGLALVGILFREFPNKWMVWSGNLFLGGMLLFCGSLYFLTYIKGTEKQSLEWIGAITPFGGLAFILGWVCMFFGVSRNG